MRNSTLTGRARSPASPPLLALLLLGLGLGLGPGPGTGTAAAQSRQPGDTPIEDLLEIVFLPRHVLAIDAQGGQTREQLELNEEVVWWRSRGRVGVVLTDRRILAVGTDSGAWQTERLRLSERIPDGAFLGDRLAVILTRQRLLAFSSLGRNLVETEIGPNERVTHVEVNSNAGVVLTPRRAIGVSPFVSTLREESLQLGERIESISVRSNVAVIRTQRRLLTFRAPTGSWAERRIELYD